MHPSNRQPPGAAAPPPRNSVRTPRGPLVSILLGVTVSIVAPLALRAQAPLPNTAPLTLQGDLSAQMIAGINRFLERETANSIDGRAAYWAKTDLTGNRAAYEKSIAPNRERLASMLGVIDRRGAEIELDYVATSATPARIAEADTFTAYTVRWPVLDGLHGEGLLLQPKNAIIARVIAVPDADQTPEAIAGLAPGLPAELHYARRLAEHGCQVLIPTLIDRADTSSGNAVAQLSTNQPHREWIYRQSFVLGRHVIGYELQKILAAVDWFSRQNRDSATALPIGVVGWGEGGLLALHSAALDPRITATLVSGYFGPREQLWQEPIYRNLFGVLTEFGDANLARLIVPRTLLIEHAAAPKIDGPPAERPGRAGAAPGRIVPLELAAVRAEVDRARQYAGPHSTAIRFYHGNGDTPTGPIAERTLLSFFQALHPPATALRPPAPASLSDLRPNFDPAARQQRQVREMERYTQRQLQLAAGVRDEFLWKKIPPTTPAAWRDAMQPYRDQVWNELIGRYRTGQIPLNPRTRMIHDKPTWTGYEVVLDVLPDVYAWGYLLLPKGIKPGERRPVVVTQHGVTGLPDSVISEDKTSRAYAAYKAYAVRLAERGFIVFAPHNPYRGDHASRVLQRKAQPLGKTIFSIILAQHECILDFLSAQPNVDPARIGFYGLSYGGQSAMRLPMLLDRYALSICSGDFNEWTWKNASTDSPKSYMYNAAYERPEFRMGLTFG